MHEFGIAKKSIYDEHPKLKEFEENYKKTHPGVDINTKNLYIVQSVNRDGVVTSEQYGLNLVTDAGFDQIISNYSPSTETFRTAIRLLEGVPIAEAPTVLTYTIPSYTRRIQTSTKSGNNNFYAMQYNSETGVISQRLNQWVWEFDYNVTGYLPDGTSVSIDNDFTANCLYMYNPDYSNWCPTGIISTYEADGMPAPIIKHPNEKLFITFYTAGSIHEDVINDAYDDEIYFAVNPGKLFSNIAWGYSHSGNNHGSPPYVYSKWFGPVYTSYDLSSGVTNTWADISCSETGQRHIMGNGEGYRYGRQNMTYILLDPRVAFTMVNHRWGYRYYNDWNDTSIIKCTSVERLDTPEELSTNFGYTNNNNSPQISNLFALKAFNTLYPRGILPAADFSITSIKGYNYTSKAFDIDISYINRPDAYYNNPLITTAMAIAVAGAPSGTYYLYINQRAKQLNNGSQPVPITGISMTTSRTVYVADKYWDFSTWSLVTDPSSIPQALQNKKYFMLKDGTATITPTYDQQVHELDVGSEYTVLNTPTDSIHGWYHGYKTLHNLTDNWILVQDYLLFMDPTGKDVQYKYKLEGPEYAVWAKISDAVWSQDYASLYIYSNGEYVLNTNPTYSSGTTYYTTAIDPYTIRYNYGNKILVATMVTRGNDSYPAKVRIYTITSASSAPTYQDITIDTNTTDRSYTGQYTFSSNGYFVIQDEHTHCANIIKISDGTVTKLENVDNCYALEYSNKCVYFRYGSSPLTWDIYNMQTNTVEGSFVLPDEYSNVTYMCGWHEYLYLQSYVNPNYFVHIINTNDCSIRIIDGMTFNNQFASYRRNNNSVDSRLYRLNRINNMKFHPDFMIIDCVPMNQWYVDDVSPKFIKYTEPEKTYWLYKYGDRNERQVDNLYENNHYYCTTSRLGSTILEVQQSVSQSKLLLIDVAGRFSERYNSSVDFVSNSNSDWRAGVLDIGYRIDNPSDEPLNAVCYHWKQISIDSTYASGGVAYWKNGIIIFDTNMAGVWYPLEWFINFKITGTTRTIQAYNNPKKIGHASMTMFSTNRGIIQHTSPPTSTGDLHYVFKHDSWGYSSSDQNSIFWGKILKGEILGPYAAQYDLLDGESLSIEITPAAGFEFLSGTFLWWIEEKQLNYDANGDYVSYSNKWSSAVCYATDSISGPSRDLTNIGICIATNSNQITWLEPTYIQSIRITKSS